MNQMNQVVVEGNVVRDTTIRETARGTRVCTIPIATNHFYRTANGETQKEVAFLDVEAWGENFCAHLVRYAKKGRGLRVVGRLKQDRWKNQEGKSTSKVYILAEHIEFQHQKDEKKQSSESSALTDTENAAAGIRAEAAFPENDGTYMEDGETVF